MHAAIDKTERDPNSRGFKSYEGHDGVYLCADLAISSLSMSRLYAKARLPDGVSQCMAKARGYLGSGPPNHAHKEHLDDAWCAAATVYNECAEEYQGLGLEFELIDTRRPWEK
ncbi:hypothetical protein KY362_06135 [Candidatus Woesearchaeota archaeon]|nr:hypothetical protein [Candidatus Woesearchaeota archaeon]